MYQQYLADPSSVDQAWHEFFADYRPGSPAASGLDRGRPPPPTGAAPQPSPAPTANGAQPATPKTAADSAGAQGAATQSDATEAPAAAPASTPRATPVPERTEATVVNRAADRTDQQQPAAPAA